jgi:dihydromethanopterin reductase
MSDVRLIAAVGRSGQLGLGGQLPWKNPVDLRWFREQTIGGVVVMGGRTYDVVGELSGRVMARWSGSHSPHTVLTKIAARHPGKLIWIAGGAYTYSQFMPFVRIAVISRIDYDGEADTYMPPLWGHVHRATHRSEPFQSIGRGPAPGALLLPEPPPPTRATDSSVPRKRRRRGWLTRRQREGQR